MTTGPKGREASTLLLDGGWTVTELPFEARGEGGLLAATAARDRLPAEVPGSIHLDLLRAGRIPDPDLADNARERCRWPELRSWWYRTEFEPPAGFRDHVSQRLVFDGIDLVAEVFLNGRFVGGAENAFAVAAFDVAEHLVDGANELMVRVTSGMEGAPPPSFLGEFDAFRGVIDPRYANRSWDQSRSLRKPDVLGYGHVFCDPLPGIGITGSVRLVGRTSLALEHIVLDTVIEDGRVALSGEVVVRNLHPWAELAGEVRVELDPPDGGGVVTEIPFAALAGRNRVPCRIEVPDARLWWPNGMGEQPLYRLAVSIRHAGVETDRRRQTIGLRTVALDRSPQGAGSRFAVRVNGEDVFCRGGNWVVPDLIPSRMTPARYASLVEDARAAGFTMLRINGCGMYEADAFYDACDRAGILVWQDFMFSDARYPDHDPGFRAAVEAEAESTVRRLRHHPSIALWCGNNECQLSMVAIWGWDPDRPEASGGARLYGDVLPEVCAALDPARPYWPGSPYGGATPSDPLAGDVHAWGDDDGVFRFASEFGTIGPPAIDTVLHYLDGATPFASAAWGIHTDAFENGGVRERIRDLYGEHPDALADYVVLGQLAQAVQLERFAESARFRKDDPSADCQGALVWAFNDTWGEIGYSLVDNRHRRKAAYHALARAFAPLKVLVRPRDDELVVRLVNDTLLPRDLVVRHGWVRADGRDSRWFEAAVHLPANGAIEVARTSIAPAEGDAAWVYAATVGAGADPLDQTVWIPRPYRELGLSRPEVTIQRRPGHLELSSPVFCTGVHAVDPGGGKSAESAPGGDGFDLVPGVPRRIPLAAGAEPPRYAAVDLTGAVAVRVPVGRAGAATSVGG